MAWHWRQLGVPFRLLTRDRRRPGRRLRAVPRPARDPDRRATRSSATAPSASIDIEILPDRQPQMDHFVEGVWADYRSTPERDRPPGGDRAPARRPGRGRDRRARAAGRGRRARSTGGERRLPRLPPLHRRSASRHDARGRHRVRRLAGRPGRRRPSPALRDGSRTSSDDGWS